MRKKGKKISSLLLTIVIILSLSSPISAQEYNQNDAETSLNANLQEETNDVDIMNLEGPTVIIDLGEYGSGTLKRDADGNYSGEITTRGLRGITSVTCVLSGGTGGIYNLYRIYIKWKGTNSVVNIQATSLKISTTSILNPTTYWNNSFYIHCGSTALGYSSVGTVTIPTSVKQVRVKTTGLKCYFNYADYWISTGNLNGTVNVN